MDLRTITKDGAPWFVAKDVCAVLGLTNPSHCVVNIDAEDKGIGIVDTPGGVQKLIQVNESGLYSLILRSRKPAAKAFQRWITSVVLPAIRKDGSYVMGEEKVATGEMSLEEMTLKVMSSLTAKVQRLEQESLQQAAKLAQQAPAVETKGFPFPP